jgi:hypothetical protein
MALNRVAIPSPNYSSRGGAGVRLLVLHTAEGSRTYQSLGNYFASSSSGVSSHAGIDDTLGTIGVYVKRGDKAWTASNANPVACQAEICAFAAWDSAEWHRHPNMLSNVASWLREESAAFGIPLTKLNAQQAQSNGRGVCQHIDLGSWGGGHVDCGSGFPMDEVIAMAGGQPAPSPGPTPTPPPAGKAPPFPYPAGHYLGRPDPSPYCHSGHYGGVDSTNVRTWQQQMAHRGWAISVDGDFGDQSYSVARSFQSEKGLTVDGLVGSQTWATSWTAPVT